MALLQMRAIAIQFLKALEDDMVSRGYIDDGDRACLTRHERRHMRPSVDTTARDVVLLP